MKKAVNWMKKNKKYSIIGALALVLLLSILIKHKNGEVETFEVKRANIEESIILSGKIMNNSQADLGFASSGRISKIFVKNNQEVEAGTILAQLEIGDLLADLRIKELSFGSSSLELQNAKDELEKVTAEENGKVESAYRKLLGDGLELVPSSSSYSVDAPTISGFYGGVEGQYKINIRRKDISNDYELLTFKLENTKIIIKEEGATPLGTKGLYISFSEEISSYDDTTWYLDIPNKSSSSYLANLNAYNEAKRARDLAIKDAEFNYKKILNEEGGVSSVGQAEVDKIRAEIRKNTIYAPFKGRVTNIEKEVGENAGTGERIISILGEDTLEVELQVPELDVSKIIPNTEVKITIDAFPEEEFSGIVKTINSRETEIDGVPVYEAFASLNPDSRIKTGMSANGLIILNSKSDVLSVPIYLVEEIDGKSFVEVVLPDGEKEKREITLGLIGTDKMAEVISGLSLGEKIVATSTEQR